MNTFESAIEEDLDAVIEALEMARHVWEPDEMVKWFKSPQARWAGESPLTLIVSGRGEELCEFLETLERR